MKNELRTIYTYFSHHMRNCTAMVAASVTLLSYRMTDDEHKLIDEVIEASFLLDLFDAGMEICFAHVFDSNPASLNDNYDIEKYTLHFLDQCKNIMADRGLKLDFSMTNPCVTKGNTHELRAITNIIIYEMIFQADKSLSVELNQNRLCLTTDTCRAAPEIWKIIKDLCQKRGVSFSFDDKECVLEFAV